MIPFLKTREEIAAVVNIAREDSWALVISEGAATVARGGADDLEDAILPHRRSDPWFQRATALDVDRMLSERFELLQRMRAQLNGIGQQWDAKTRSDWAERIEIYERSIAEQEPFAGAALNEELVDQHMEAMRRESVMRDRARRAEERLAYA